MLPRKLYFPPPQSVPIWPPGAGELCNMLHPSKLVPLQKYLQGLLRTSPRIIMTPSLLQAFCLGEPARRAQTPVGDFCSIPCAPIVAPVTPAFRHSAHSWWNEIAADYWRGQIDRDQVYSHYFPSNRLNDIFLSQMNSSAASCTAAAYSSLKKAQLSLVGRLSKVCVPRDPTKSSLY